MYEVLADYYDLFTDPADRAEWVDFAVSAVSSKRAGADVGCGSGAVAESLFAAGHSVVAVDSSPEMLGVARDRFLRKGLAIPTVLMSADELVLPHKTQFITAMCDVVNYLPRPEKFFSAASDNLEAGGLLVFDVSSERKLRDVLANNVFTRTVKDVTYVWENTLENDHVDMELTFFVPTGGGLYRKRTDTQRQYVHRADDLVAALVKHGFETEVTDRGDRIFFVAKKAG